MPRMVKCAKLGRELPGLERPPFPGPLGERIYNEISQEAWDMWREYQTLVINHYSLNPADPDDREILREQMEAFFFSEEGRMPEGWSPEGSTGGAPAKGAAPRKK